MAFDRRDAQSAEVIALEVIPAGSGHGHRVMAMGVALDLGLKHPLGINNGGGLRVALG